MDAAGEAEARYLPEDSRTVDDADEDLASAVRQLREFIPGIGARAATTIKRMYRDDLGRFQEFKAQGELWVAPLLLSAQKHRQPASVSGSGSHIPQGRLQLRQRCLRPEWLFKLNLSP